LHEETKPLNWRPVAALALFDSEGRLLLQQRPPGKRHGGLWEFPGGKVELGETPRAALVREIAEELAIALDEHDLEPALIAEEPGELPIVLLLYAARRWRGEPQGCEGQAWGWFNRAASASQVLAPMDRTLLARLCWPS
jgi:8-oxo-dGTP diphosphatase